GQISSSAAEIYEDFFVPALFGQWPERLLEAAGVAAGQRVLDVGCGTGVLARAASRRVGARGEVVGLDPNEGMLAVARRVGAQTQAVRWQRGVVEDLPFADDHFDHVLSQFAVMFFADRGAALTQMARVTRPGGRVVLASWAALETTPGYAKMVALIRRRFGDVAAAALEAPFVLGEPESLRALLAEVSQQVSAVQVAGEARFASIRDWVHTDVYGWTLRELIDARGFEALLQDAERELSCFCEADGRVRFAAPAIIASAVIG
ncbi:MAG: methyltransferase domain-containing protein, partial [Myxococcales bacterium]|nr:methyltransferase domain-containing protein [Myxococcales bacterium]